jgi:2-aminoethylphosphonate-pyruvate transaminase
MIHSETTSGNINNVEKLSKIVKEHNQEAIVLVDSMSSFGGIPIKELDNIDLLVSTSNKCLHGQAGCAFVIANKEILEKGKGKAISYSFDLIDQVKGLDNNGQFRFTPPVQILLGLEQGLKEHFDNGGTEEKYKRYCENADFLVKGMENLGFTRYELENPGPIIQTFNYPCSDFDFEDFYDKLAKEDLFIYPGKLTTEQSFRISTIGDLYKEDIELLLKNIKQII